MRLRCWLMISYLDVCRGGCWPLIGKRSSGRVIVRWLSLSASGGSLTLASAAEGRRKGVGRIGDWEVMPVCGAARDAVAEGAAVIG